MTPLLLCHAALGSAEQFAPLVARLDGRYDLHAPDFPAHGDAPCPAQAMSTAALVDATIAYLDAHDLERVHVFGHSLGGYVALCLALRTPARVASVHTLGTRLFWDEEAAAAMLGELNPALIEQKVRAFADALARRHRAMDWRQLVVRTAAHIEVMGRAADLDLDALGMIECPVRLAVGDRDHLVSLEMTAAGCAALPHGQLMVLPRTAHPMESARAELIAASIEDFVGA